MYARKNFLTVKSNNNMNAKDHTGMSAWLLLFEQRNFLNENAYSPGHLLCFILEEDK